jgi:hypothetical protein
VEPGSKYALHCDPRIHSSSLPGVTVVNTYDSKLNLEEVCYYDSPTIRSWQRGAIVIMRGRGSMFRRTILVCVGFITVLLALAPVVVPEL